MSPFPIPRSTRHIAAQLLAGRHLKGASCGVDRPLDLSMADVPSVSGSNAIALRKTWPNTINSDAQLLRVSMVHALAAQHSCGHNLPSCCLMLHDAGRMPGGPISLLLAKHYRPASNVCLGVGPCRPPSYHPPSASAEAPCEFPLFINAAPVPERRVAAPLCSSCMLVKLFRRKPTTIPVQLDAGNCVCIFAWEMWYECVWS